MENTRPRPGTDASGPSGCYMAVCVASALVVGDLFLLPTLVFYPVAAGVAYGLYHISSNIVVFNSLRGGNQSSSLSVCGAVVGVATTIGSLPSGMTLFYLGFDVTFVLAGLLLGFSPYTATRLPKEPT